MKAKRQVYLDYAAATPVDQRVLQRMTAFFSDDFYNPSALYLRSKQVKAALDEARASVAGLLGVNPSEVIFTAGGTEANNLAVQGVLKQYPDGNVVVSAVEHDSVLKAAAAYPYQVCPVTAKGQVDLTVLRRLIDDHTVLVSIMHANNETGALQPLAAIADLISEIRTARKQAGNDTPLYFHTDASQSANYVSVKPHQLGVDLLTINGGKIYGPKQTGVLFISAGVRLAPVIYGGGQERGLRSGTENIAGAVGFAEALRLTDKKRKYEVKRLGELQATFTQGLTAAFPNVIINSHDALVNFVHITLPGVDNERLVMELDERGIQCAVGSACSASSDEPSHVLKAMGLSDAAARSSIRFSLGRFTTAADIDYTLACMTDVVKA